MRLNFEDNKGAKVMGRKNLLYAAMSLKDAKLPFKTTDQE